MHASMVSSVALGWRIGGLIQAGASTHRGLRRAPPAKAPGEWKTCEATRSALQQPQHVRCKRGRKGSGACGRPTFVVLVVDALQSFHFHLLFLIVLCASSTRHSPVGTMNFTQPSMHVPLMVVSLAIGRPVCPVGSPNFRHQSRTGERGAVMGPARGCIRAKLHLCITNHPVTTHHSQSKTALCRQAPVCALAALNFHNGAGDPCMLYNSAHGVSCRPQPTLHTASAAVQTGSPGLPARFDSCQDTCGAAVTASDPSHPALAQAVSPSTARVSEHAPPAYSVLACAAWPTRAARACDWRPAVTPNRGWTALTGQQNAGHNGLTSVSRDAPADPARQGPPVFSRTAR